MIPAAGLVGKVTQNEAKKRARAQRQAKDAARRRRAQTAAARAANSARTHPGIRAHDALVLPEIACLRADGYPPGVWHATAAWCIVRRHGVA